MLKRKSNKLKLLNYIRLSVCQPTHYYLLILCVWIQVINDSYIYFSNLQFHYTGSIEF